MCVFVVCLCERDVRVCLCVCVCECERDVRVCVPWRSRQSVWIDRQQLPTNRNMIYFPRNDFNMRRESERDKGREIERGAREG